jgi:hypothetical protein
VASCRVCGARLSRGARYCTQCGRPTDAGETDILDLPPEETGEVSIHHVRADRRLYGVTPATAALVVAAAALTLAIVFFATGHWPLGLVLLGVAMLLVLLFFEAARRTPRGTKSRSTAEALDGFRLRAGVAADSLASRGRAARELVQIRRELRQMWAFRSQLLLELGDAVYRGDDEASRTARARIDELDRLAAQREEYMQQVVETTQQRLERRRLEVQPTMIAEAPRPPETPAPGEGNPPEPARIPEPYPPPDEGSPPQPAVIPEPTPAIIPEPGPQGRDVRRTAEP